MPTRSIFEDPFDLGGWPPRLSAEEIAQVRAHPNFHTAFLASGEHATRPALTLGPLRSLFKDRGSQTIGTLALSLYDTEEGLTAGRLTRMCVESRICSAGRVESYIALMRQRGALVPLAKGAGVAVRYGFSHDYLAWFRDYVRHGIRALALVEPASAAALPLMAGDDFFHYMRRTLASASINPPLVPDKGPELLLFAQRDAGLAILSDLVAGQVTSEAGRASVSVADLARRHGASRAHVLKLLRDGDAAGAFVWSPEARTVTLPDWMLERLELGVAVTLLNRRYAARAVLAAPRRALTIRTATPADVDALRALMEKAIRIHLAAYLPPEGVAASFEIMGLDTQLIADGTYFVVEADGQIAGCGGWSRRATLFGGDHSAGRDSGLVDPATEPARIRAMYTHPDFARRGVGKLILDTCEAAAAAEGFRRAEMAATLSGEPLYLATGYKTLEPFEAETSTGYRVPLIRMGKPLP